MDVDTNVPPADIRDMSVMASSATVGSVTVSLHPVVILNISEHWTRVRAQQDGKQQQGYTPK